MEVLSDGVLAFTLDVPELDGSISTSGENVSSVLGNGTGENLLLVTILDESGDLSVSEIPESEFSVP